MRLVRKALCPFIHMTPTHGCSSYGTICLYSSSETDPRPCTASQELCYSRIRKVPAGWPVTGICLRVPCQSAPVAAFLKVSSQMTQFSVQSALFVELLVSGKSTHDFRKTQQENGNSAFLLSRFHLCNLVRLWCLTVNIFIPFELFICLHLP